MAVKTILERGIEICVEHRINVKYCRKCQEAMAKSKAPTVNDRILAVLADNQWHTQRDIAEKAGLVEGESYVDIGRDMRSMRTKEAGEHPIGERRCEDNKVLSEYRLLPIEEAAAFWAKRAERLARNDAVGLRRRVSELEAEKSELMEYIGLLELDLARLRAAPISTHAQAAVPVAAQAAAA